MLHSREIVSISMYLERLFCIREIVLSYSTLYDGSSYTICCIVGKYYRWVCILRDSTVVRR